MTRPIVLHFHQKFFSRSETFIYNYISSLKEFYALCYGWKYLNSEQFPLSQDQLIRPSVHDSVIDRILYRSFLKLTGRNFLPARLLDKMPFCLVHAHFGPQGYYALRLKKRFQVPLVTTFYGYDVSQLAKSSLWRERYTWLFDKGDMFLVEGKHMRKCLVALGCPEEKIQIQRIAIPLEKIVFRPRLAKNGAKVKLIFAGRFYEKKGLLDTLKALKIVYESFKQFQFDIIGDGPLKARIQKFIEQNNMKDYVIIHGFLTYAQYLQKMSEADIFIHPSITAKNGDTEGGAPTVILEAQAMGMPIVSTYHADIPNIVEPGQSALLSPEGDYEDIACNVLELLRNQQKWAAMGKVGRNFVEHWHDVKSEVVLLEEKYQQLINNDRRK